MRRVVGWSQFVILAMMCQVSSKNDFDTYRNYFQFK